MRPEKAEAAFWRRVGKDRLPADACWPYMGYRDPKGYGRVNRGGKKFGAHRLALELVGIKTTGKDVLHTCDNRPCCNPAHLRLGTNAENVKDKMERGVPARGEKLSHLTEAQVIEMRQLRADGNPVTDLARWFKVHTSVVSRICTGLTWKHAGGPIVQKIDRGRLPTRALNPDPKHQFGFVIDIEKDTVPIRWVKR